MIHDIKSYRCVTSVLSVLSKPRILEIVDTHALFIYLVIPSSFDEAICFNLE